jgi:hypothetical protein
MSTDAGFSFPDDDPLTDGPAQTGSRPSPAADRAATGDVKRLVIERRTSAAADEPQVDGLSQLNDATNDDWDISDISIAERFETDPRAGSVVTRLVVTLRRTETRSLFDFDAPS